MGNGRALRPARCEIGILPDEVIIDIASRVASCSLRDLFNCRQSCKPFNRCGQDPLVLRQAPTQDIYTRRFELEEHREAAYAFLRLCADSGNPGALYGQGLLKYFGGTDEPYGLECLERSVALGHTPAGYVLAVVLLCSQEQGQDQDQLVERVMNLLRPLWDSAGAGIFECRSQVVRFLYYNPPAPFVVARFKQPRWSGHREPGQRRCRVRNPRCGWSYWVVYGFDDARWCWLCNLEREAKLFCSLFDRQRWVLLP